MVDGQPQGLSRTDRLKMLKQESVKQREEEAVRRKAEIGRINKTDISVSEWYQMDMNDRIFHDGFLFINESKHMLRVNVVTRAARRENQKDDASVEFVDEKRMIKGKDSEDWRVCVVIKDC